MDITVYDFLFFAIEDSYMVKIWGEKVGDYVFVGDVTDARYGEYGDENVNSFDLLPSNDPFEKAAICINID